jgi:hypothetical protein
MTRRYRTRIDLPRITHYELVVDNGETEERRTYAHEECGMASSAFYRAQADGAFAAQLYTHKSDGSSYRSMNFSRN